MNKKEKQEIMQLVTETVVSVLTAKADVTKQEKKTKKQEKNDIPPHKKADIPTLLDGMTRTQSIKLFGDITKNPPYKMQISPFFNAFNIQLDSDKYERKTLTYEQKHKIILTQLKGQDQKVFDKEKKRHLKDLREKIANPPVTNIFGKEMTDKQLESREGNLQKEVSRWENDKYQE